MELHETVMGKRLIERTLPKMTDALDRIANAMERKEKEWYVVFTTTNDLFNDGETIDNIAMFETEEDAKSEYKKALDLDNLHSAGMARLVEGTDWPDWNTIDK
tara:strand:- start:1121 stop:1429 length:309 start_codon:yes stop_codon:yes gene_type:complete